MTRPCNVAVTRHQMRPIYVSTGPAAGDPDIPANGYGILDLFKIAGTNGVELPIIQLAINQGFRLLNAGYMVNCQDNTNLVYAVRHYFVFSVLNAKTQNFLRFLPVVRQGSEGLGGAELGALGLPYDVPLDWPRDRVWWREDLEKMGDIDGNVYMSCGTLYRNTDAVAHRVQLGVFAEYELHTKG